MQHTLHKYRCHILLVANKQHILSKYFPSVFPVALFDLTNIYDTHSEGLRRSHIPFLYVIFRKICTGFCCAFCWGHITTRTCLCSCVLINIWLIWTAISNRYEYNTNSCSIKLSDSHPLWFNRNGVTHIGVGKLGHHWLRSLLVACSESSHYLIICRFIFN